MSYAEIYKWTDESGKVHYTDKKHEKGKVVTVKTTNIPPIKKPEKKKEKSGREIFGEQVRQRQIGHHNKATYQSIMSVANNLKSKVERFHRENKAWPRSFFSLKTDKERLTKHTVIDSINIRSGGEIYIRVNGGNDYVKVKPKTVHEGRLFNWNCKTSLSEDYHNGLCKTL